MPSPHPQNDPSQIRSLSGLFLLGAVLVGGVFFLQERFLGQEYSETPVDLEQQRFFVLDTADLSGGTSLPISPAQRELLQVSSTSPPPLPPPSSGPGPQKIFEATAAVSPLAQAPSSEQLSEDAVPGASRVEPAEPAVSTDRPSRAYQPHPMRVRVASVTAAPEYQERRFYGVSRSARQADLSFTTGGRLEERLVDLGDHVEEEAVIARLDRRPFRHAYNSAAANVEALRATLDQLQRDRQRMERLVEANAGVQEDLEHLRSTEATLLSNLDAARAQRDAARQQLDEATLVAPFSGIVAAVSMEAGEMAVPGATVITLSGEEIEVEVHVPESFLAHLQDCERVWVDFPVAGLWGVPAEVSAVVDSALGPGFLYPIVLVVESSGPVAPGMTAEAVFYLRCDSALAVPVEAIVDPTGASPAVFMVDDGIARRVGVEVLGLVDDQAIIRAQLPGDAEVVVGGQHRISDGQLVDSQR